MPEDEKEGWYEDPARRHTYRWFSAGEPTSLVKDGGRTSTDEISFHDAELFRSMELAREPDNGPLLRTANTAEPHFELMNLGAGPAWVVNTASDRTYSEPRYGAVTRVIALVPVVLGFVVLALLSAPGIGFLALTLWPLLVLGVATVVTRGSSGNGR